MAGNRLARRWAREPRPYGSATRGAMGGRPQGSPLRKRCKECDAVRNPPVTASPCQPPLGKGAEGTGDADCHDQFAHWLRNDIGFSWGCGVRRGTWAPPYKGLCNIAGGQGRPPLRCCVTKKSVGEGLCPSRGRGNRRSAAGGGCSEPVSRKCPDWRTRQWPGIGWHDGGQENPAPTEAQQEVQWAGDRKGRPYESGTRSVTSIGRADVGSELSAAGGRGSEVSEWPRSKF